MQRHDYGLVALAAVFLVAAVCATPAQAKLTGAVWTTLCDGSRVDHNVYAAKEDVYLNGGPYGESGAWVPNGDYYFMVTDPPGKILLSTDPIDKRMVRIEGGKILQPDPVPPYTDHNWCEDLLRPGNFTIQLMPYLDSPNGEYKAWLTPVACYDEGSPRAKFGFIPSSSKTDNFRIRSGRLCIFGHKWSDENGDGVWDPGEPPLADWAIVLSRKQGGGLVQVAVSQTAGDGSYAFCLSEKGTYVLSEVLQPGWVQTAPPDPGTFTVPVNNPDLRRGEDKGPYDFGNTEDGGPQYQLSGTKYRDDDQDGTWDPDEPVLEGWCVTITRDDGVEDHACTDAAGLWGPVEVETGHMYTICEDPPVSPWFQTGPLPGLVIDPDTWTTADRCYEIVVPPGAVQNPNHTKLDFGNTSECGKIAVFKFEDYDRNGIMDGIDRPLKGWYMFLYDDAGRILEWGPTGADGTIVFPQDPDEYLGPGCYTVAEMEVPDWWCVNCTEGDPDDPLGQVVCIDADTCAAYLEFANAYEHSSGW